VSFEIRLSLDGMSVSANKISILIPAYNEEKTIVEVLKKVAELPMAGGLEKEIIVINDRSSDNTGSLIDNFIQSEPGNSIRVHHQEFNQGKGAALHKGIDLATGDLIIIQDADLELNPEDMNRLLEEWLKGKSNVIYGSRFLLQQHENTNFLWHIMGNGFLTRLSNLITGVKLTDMMTCYKLVPSSIMKELQLKENRFGFEPEVTVKLAKRKGVQFKEVPISYSARKREEGKKINYKDGFRVIYCLFKYRFS